MFEVEIVEFQNEKDSQVLAFPAKGQSGYYWDSSVLVQSEENSFSPMYWIYVKNESALTTSFEANARFNRGFGQRILNV